MQVSWHRRSEDCNGHWVREGRERGLRHGQTIKRNSWKSLLQMSSSSCIILSSVSQLLHHKLNVLASVVGCCCLLLVGLCAKLAMTKRAAHWPRCFQACTDRTTAPGQRWQLSFLWQPAELCARCHCCSCGPLFALWLFIWVPHVPTAAKCLIWWHF